MSKHRHKSDKYRSRTRSPSRPRSFRSRYSPSTKSRSRSRSRSRSPSLSCYSRSLKSRSPSGSRSRYSRSPKSRNIRSCSLSDTRIFFRGFPVHWTSMAIEEYFDEFGTIVTIKTFDRHPGAGIVLYKNPYSAKNCIQESKKRTYWMNSEDEFYVYYEDTKYNYENTKYNNYSRSISRSRSQKNNKLKRHESSDSHSNSNSTSTINVKHNEYSKNNTINNIINNINNMKDRIDIKREKILLNEWNEYAVIYWLNRINDGKFGGIKYFKLRNHIINAELKGFELNKLNNVTLRLIGIKNEKDQTDFLNSIAELVVNDDFDNMAANIGITEEQKVYCDPITFEIMNDPVLIIESGYTYEREYIEKYIGKYNKDPVTGQKIELNHIVSNQALKKMIQQWIQKKLDFIT